MIDLIQKEYAGKTVVVVSHFHPVRCFLHELNSKKATDQTRNADYYTLYLDHNTGKEINLHRPYIDRIYIPAEKHAAKKVNKKDTTKLVILRHAESEANVAKCYDDIGDSPLSEKGKKHAEELVSQLQKEGIEVILSSPFVRAIQTIAPFAKQAKIQIEEMVELRETGHGKFANQPQQGGEWTECRKRFDVELDYKF